MVATEIPTVIAFKQHIQNVLVEIYFLIAKWLWGGDWVRPMVFGEKQITNVWFYTCELILQKIQSK